MTYLWVWRLASPAPLCDPPRLVLAGRLYQQTQQLYVLYMLRDKMGRRGFSDKTVKDYLSFGGPVVICYQNGFCVKKKDWQEWKEDGKGWKRGREVEAGGLKMAEGGGSCHAGKDFVFCLISCPLPPLPSWHPLYPMSRVSVTFWTCQANTVEWLELSVKVMWCLPLEEPEKDGQEERVITVENKLRLKGSYLTFMLEITNDKLWWRQRSGGVQAFPRLRDHTDDLQHCNPTLSCVASLQVLTKAFYEDM